MKMADRQAIPTPVELENTEGEIHCHTNESDRRDTLETMVEAAGAKGYEYIAITDHSAGQGDCQQP